MGTNDRKRTTLADLMAAAELGAIDPTTAVVTADEAAELAAAASAAATAARPDPVASATPVATVALPADRHDCGIAGCRHGAGHDGPRQPDRQVKLACPNCGAVARMTTSAIARAARAVGGTDETAGWPRCPDGGTYQPAARRQYTRRTA